MLPRSLSAALKSSASKPRLPPLPFLTAFLFAIVLLPVKSYSFQLFGICQRLVVL